MDFGLTGRKAVVCGGSKGLGLAIARKLTEEGAEVILLSRDKASLTQACADLGGKSSFVSCDLTDQSSIESAIAEIKQRFGGPDILVHNVGGPTPSFACETGLEQWTSGFNRLFLTVAHLNNAFLPSMQERGWGRIVTVTSLSVLEPIAFLAVSNVMRSASTALTKTLSDEVAKFNITVNCVAPGMIATARTDELLTARVSKSGQSREDYMADLLKGIPSGRLGEPDEFGSVVCFLCSNQASYITGSTICVDGGKRRSTY
ncbi:MAG: SDR family oxidoreductase [Candidatus Obscuribacterales bacterium]|nr:SDR family oxidoreductase [Candidatus Obscuribacterales bacterium]